MELLHKRYEIIKRLSDTTIFEVYLAKDCISDISVSVYRVRNEFLQDVDFIEGLTSGIIDCRDLNHPHTLKFMDVDVQDNSVIYVYEYADGVSLKEVFEKQHKLAMQKSVEIAIAVLQSLDNAHLMGVCHGDLYPDDIFITQDGHIKVRGYGRKDGIERSSIAKEHLSLETIKYQSPEVLEATDLLETSDVYSVGVMLYQMLTGKIPYDGNTSVEIATKILRDAPLSPRMLNRELPASLSSLVLEAMAKENNARVGTSSIFISRLMDVLRGYKTGEYSNSPRENIIIKQVKEEKKKSTAPLLITLFIIVCVLTTLITVYSVNSQKTKMPNLVGLTEDDAINKLQGLKLGFKKGEDVFSTEYEVGTIVEQTPAAGERIGKKEIVEYKVSKGADTIKMPYIIGLDIERAKEKLALGNLSVTIKEEYSNSVPENTVISTFPEAETVMPNGANVELTVSKGSSTAGVISGPLPNTDNSYNDNNSNDNNIDGENNNSTVDNSTPNTDNTSDSQSAVSAPRKTRSKQSDADMINRVDRKTKKTQPTKSTGTTSGSTSNTDATVNMDE